MTRSSTAAARATPAEVLSRRELLSYRLLGLLAALIILGLGVAHRVVDAGSVDPLWERLVVAGCTLAAVGVSFVYRGVGYRYVVYGVYYLITFWVVHLLLLNDFSVDYALSIFIVVSGISALFRSPSALAWYLAATVAAVTAAAAVVTEPAPVGLSRSLYVIDVGVVCFLLYVTMSARLESESELRDTEAYYRALIENAEDVIAVVDEEGRLSYVSPASEQVFGRDVDELRGRPAVTLVHPEDRDRLRDRLDEVSAAPDRSVKASLRVLRDDGTERHVEVEIQNLLQDPAVEGVVVNLRDVTGRVQLEQDLRRSQKMEAVGRLAGGVAHDFNNLLTVISGQTEILLDRLPEGSELRDDTEEILDAARRASGVTRQLLAVGRRQALEPVVFDLGDEVRDLEKMLESLTGEDVGLRVRVGEGPLPVKADPAQVERVIVNLVVNARDAMPEGGCVTVEAGRGRARGHEGAGACVLEVSDTGVGIPEEEQEQIFEPFFTTKDDGTGLGLATVYGIVEQSGGTIELESEPGRGTTFRVLLPLEEGASRTAEAGAD